MWSAERPLGSFGAVQRSARRRLEGNPALGAAQAGLELHELERGPAQLLCQVSMPRDNALLDEGGFLFEAVEFAAGQAGAELRA